MINVRVHPNAPATRIRDTLPGGTLKIDLAAPAEDNKANAELIAFLARACDVAKANVEIVSGRASRKKTVRIAMEKPPGFAGRHERHDRSL